MLQAAGSTAIFLLVPANANMKADLTEIYDVCINPTGLTTLTPYTFTGIYPPTATLISVLRGNVQITNFPATNFVTTDVIRMVVRLDDPNGDLNHVTITADMGTNRILLLSRTLAQSRS